MVAAALLNSFTCVRGENASSAPSSRCCALHLQASVYSNTDWLLSSPRTPKRKEENHHRPTLKPNTISKPQSRRQKHYRGARAPITSLDLPLGVACQPRRRVCVPRVL